MRLELELLVALVQLARAALVERAALGRHLQPALAALPALHSPITAAPARCRARLMQGSITAVVLVLLALLRMRSISVGASLSLTLRAL